MFNPGARGRRGGNPRYAKKLGFWGSAQAVSLPCRGAVAAMPGSRWRRRRSADASGAERRWRDRQASGDGEEEK
jgi:hypothetical protein